MKKFNEFIQIKESTNTKNTIIGGVECKITGQVHQNSGNIYVGKPGIDDDFSEEEHRKVYEALKENGMHPKAGMRLHNGKRFAVTLHIGSDEITDLFQLYIESQLSDYANL